MAHNKKNTGQPHNPIQFGFNFTTPQTFCHQRHMPYPNVTLPYPFPMQIHNYLHILYQAKWGKIQLNFTYRASNGYALLSSSSRRRRLLSLVGLAATRTTRPSSSRYHTTTSTSPLSLSFSLHNPRQSPRRARRPLLPLALSQLTCLACALLAFALP